MMIQSVPLLRLLGGYANNWFYRQLHPLCDSVEGALLTQHILFLWLANREQPVLRFRKPCNHPQYTPGTSLEEELGLKRRGLETALKDVAYRCPLEDGSPSRDHDKGFVHYWSDSQRRSYYATNPQPLALALYDAFRTRKPDFLPVDLHAMLMTKSDISPPPLMTKSDISPPDVDLIYKRSLNTLNDIYISDQANTKYDISPTPPFSREEVMRTAEKIGLPEIEAEKYLAYYSAKPAKWFGVENLTHHLTLWKLNRRTFVSGSGSASKSTGSGSSKAPLRKRSYD